MSFANKIKKWLAKEGYITRLFRRMRCAPLLVLTSLAAKKEAKYLGYISLAMLVLSWVAFFQTESEGMRRAGAFMIGAVFMLTMILLALGFGGKVVLRRRKR